MKLFSLRFSVLVLAVLMLAGCTLVNNLPSDQNPSTTGTTAEAQPNQAPTISQVNLYQIIPNGAESEYTGTKTIIGCSDSLIAVPTASNIAEDKKYGDMRKLMRQFDNSSKDIHNPRKMQDFLEFISYEIRDGNLIINLSGDLVSENNCDIPRLEETIKANYKQFGFDRVDIMIGKKEIHEFGNAE